MAEQNDPVEETAEARHPSQGKKKGRVRYFYDRFVRLHGSPEQIALGAALGFFVAMSPTMGIQTYIAVPLAALFRISKVAAALTVWLSNPLTAPFIYGFNYVIGAKLLGYPLKAAYFSDPSWEAFRAAGKQVFLSLALGGVLSGIVVAVAGYFLTLGMVKAARTKARRLKHKKE